MAAVKNADIPEIFQFMGDFWNLIKATWDVEMTDAYSRQVIDGVNELYIKYPQPFVKSQVMAYRDYVYETQKQRWKEKSHG